MPAARARRKRNPTKVHLGYVVVRINQYGKVKYYTGVDHRGQRERWDTLDWADQYKLKKDAITVATELRRKVRSKDRIVVAELVLRTVKTLLPDTTRLRKRRKVKAA